MSILSKSPVSMFLATTQVDTCKAFYGDALGLRLVDESIFALVYELQGVEFRIAKVKELNPMPFTVLDWQIEDIDEGLSFLDKSGVERVSFDGMGQDVRLVWTAPDGTQIAWIKDPDGNFLSISERAKKP